MTTKIQDSINCASYPKLKGSIPVTINMDPPDMSIAQLLERLANDDDPLNQLIQEYSNDAKALAEAETKYAQFISAMEENGLVPSEEQKQLVANHLGIPQLQQALASLKAQLKKIDPLLSDADFNVVDDSLKSLTKTLASNGYIGNDKIGEDLATIDQAITTGLKALLSKIEADKCQQIMDHLDPDSPEYAKYLAEQMSDMMSAQQSMYTMEDDLIFGTTDAKGNKILGFIDYYNEKSSAEGDKDGIQWYSGLQGGVKGILDAQSQKQKDQEIINNDNSMMSWISDMVVSLGPMIANLNPELSGPMHEIEELLKKAMGIAQSSDLSSSEKLGQIMDVMIAIVTILSVTLTVLANERMRDEKEMEKGTQLNIDMQQSDQQLQLKKMENAQKYADVMKVVMKVSEGVMTGVMALTSGGALSALVVLAMGVAEQLGLMDQATKALANKIGGSELWASVIISAGGAVTGAGLDKAAERLTLKAIETTAATVMLSMQPAIQAAADRIGSQEAKAMIEKAVNKAVEKAVITSFDRLAAKNTLNRAVVVASKSFDVGTTSYKELLQTVYQEIREAGEQAAKKTIDEVEEPIALAIQSGNIANAEKAAEVMGEKIGTQIGKKADLLPEQSRLEKVKGWLGGVLGTNRAALGLYAIASTDLLTKLVEAMKKDSKDDQVLQIFLSIINSLLFALSSASAGGMMSSSESAQSVTKATFDKWANRLAIVATGSEALAQGCTADATLQQGEAQAAMIKDSGNIELFQMILTRIFDASKTANDKLVREMELEASSNSRIDPYRGESTGAEVLIAG